MLAVGCLVGCSRPCSAARRDHGRARAGSAVGLIAFLRPSLVKTLHAGPELQTGAAALIGHPVQVLTMLAPGQTGRVKIGGDEWTAAPYDEFDEIEPGERAEVVEIRGATAYVRRA
jgi:membrane protein implicated in regulation of membrane protease activity